MIVGTRLIILVRNRDPCVSKIYVLVFFLLHCTLFRLMYMYNVHCTYIYSTILKYLYKRMLLLDWQYLENYVQSGACDEIMIIMYKLILFSDQFQSEY